MRIKFVIIALLFVLPLAAKKKQPVATIEPEREQQFSYYWYAAREAINNEQYGDAFALLEFCRWIKPDDGTTLYQLGILHQGLGHETQAKECFELAYAAQPKGTANEGLLEQLKHIYINEGQW